MCLQPRERKREQPAPLKTWQDDAALCVFSTLKNLWTYLDQKHRVVDRCLSFQGIFSASLPTRIRNSIFGPFVAYRSDRLFLTASCFNSIKEHFEDMFFSSQTCNNAECANGKHLAPGRLWHFQVWLNLKSSQSSLRNTHFKDSCRFDSFIYSLFILNCLFWQNLVEMTRNETVLLNS